MSKILVMTMKAEDKKQGIEHQVPCISPSSINQQCLSLCLYYTVHTHTDWSVLLLTHYCGGGGYKALLWLLLLLLLLLQN